MPFWRYFNFNYYNQCFWDRTYLYIFHIHKKKLSGSKPNVSYREREDLIFFMKKFLINEWLLCSLRHICVYICIFLYTKYFVPSTKHSMEVNESFIGDRLLYVPLGHPVLAAGRKDNRAKIEFCLVEKHRQNASRPVIVEDFSCQ